MSHDRNRSLGIYWALLASLVIPFALTLHTALVSLAPPDFKADPTSHGYTVSLLIFIIPFAIFWLWLELNPKFHLEKKIYRYTIAGILVFGSLLDLFLGYAFFYFPNPGAVIGVLIPAFSFADCKWIPAYLPIEEFGFYLFGAAYMISLYVWGVLYWFKRYNHPNHRRASQNLDRICSFNVQAFILCVLLCIAGYIYKKQFSSHPEGFPGYFTFLMMLACLPCMILYDVTKYFINWRSFTFMSFMLLLVSIVYEATLGVPYGWWKYNEDQMLGINLTGWSGLPIEAVILWIAAGFGTVLIYEALRLFFFMDRPLGAALFGHGRPKLQRHDRDRLLGAQALPDYVDDGVGLPVPRGPYANPRVDMANFLIKVDLTKIRQVCDRYLNDVLNNDLKYIPFLSVVLLTYAKIVGYALDDQQQKMGLLPENDMVIWIPTIAVRYVMGIPIPTHLAMFPYRLYVDSAYGLSAGREVYGFQKTYASFTPVPDIAKPDVVVTTLAFPTYQPESFGQEVPTITVKQLSAAVGATTFKDAQSCKEGFFKFLFGADHSNVILEGIEGLGKFIIKTFQPATTSVSIKQFRDVAEPNKACFQQVIEAQSQITEFFGGGLLGSHQINFATLASDPLVQDLGIVLVDGQQTVGLGFWISTAFTMELGKVIS